MKKLLILFSLISLAVGVAGFAIAAKEYRAQITRAADCQASSLGALTAILFDTDGHPHSEQQSVAIAHELLDMNTITAGTFFHRMSTGPRQRVIADARRAAANRDAGATANNDGSKSWVERTRSCLVTSRTPDACLHDLPAKMRSNKNQASVTKSR